MNLEYLDFLICHAPCYILKYALDQLSKILPHDSISRKKFVASGALKKIQEIRQTAEGILFEYITIINDCFPEEVVRYYSPGYEDILMERVESYQIPIHTDADES